MSRPLKVISLFSGCGGLDLGFQQAGFEVIWANEIDKYACQTYIHNIGNHIVQDDIHSITRNDLPDDIDVVIGGFPCQGFSMAGKREVNDERNFLYLQMKRIIELVQPTYFVAENVRGLLSMLKGKVIEKIVDDFKNLGYHVEFKLFYAPHYGVPQERYRVFIVGSKVHNEILFPEPTFVNPITVREAFSDLPSLGNLPNHTITQKWPSHYDTIMEYIGAGQKLCNSRHGSSSVYTWDIPNVYGDTTSVEKEILLSIAKNRRRKEFGEKDGNPLPISTIATLSGFSEDRVVEIVHSLVSKEYLVEKEPLKYDITKANFTRFKRIEWDSPSPTILTNFDNPRNYVHPSENRPLTVREAARLQTFPDDFEFFGTVQAQYRQVGNAVPPLLAKEMATSLLHMHENYLHKGV